MGLGKDVFRLRKEGQWRKARGRLLNVKYKAVELVLTSEGCAGTASAREHLLLPVAPPLWFSASELPAGARRWECVCPVTVYWCCLVPGWVGGVARSCAGACAGPAARLGATRHVPGWRRGGWVGHQRDGGFWHGRSRFGHAVLGAAGRMLPASGLSPNPPWDVRLWGNLSSRLVR